MSRGELWGELLNTPVGPIFIHLGGSSNSPTLLSGKGTNTINSLTRLSGLRTPVFICGLLCTYVKSPIKKAGIAPFEHERQRNLFDKQNEYVPKDM